MSEDDADKTPYNPFDLTKVWPHSDCPLIEVGMLELNRNPENYFAEVEQASFSPTNVVPGIGHSPDRVLQFRIVSYGDAARYRVGSTTMRCRLINPDVLFITTCGMAPCGSTTTAEAPPTMSQASWSHQRSLQKQKSRR